MFLQIRLMRMFYFCKWYCHFFKPNNISIICQKTRCKSKVSSLHKINLIINPFLLPCIFLPLQLNGEPHSYTRFNLTQNMEGDNSQVEMKLSSDMEEEVGGNGVGEHLNHNPTNKPYMTQRLRRSPKNLCFMAAATLLIFIIGKWVFVLTKFILRVHYSKITCGAPQGSILGPLLFCININLYRWCHEKTQYVFFPLG